MAAGWLYVLINPSMPGLAKVGKTTRAPHERAGELSSATGVPTSFVLVYQQATENCDEAERWVHRELERRGHRLSTNREFFTAPLHEVVEVVVQSSQLVFTCDESPGSADGLDNEAHDLAEMLYEQGMEALEGTPTVLKSRSKARDLFVQAGQLGHGDACEMAGLLYHYGADHDRDRNAESALHWYLRAIALGHPWAHASIALLFRQEEQIESSQHHWRLFFQKWSDDQPRQSPLYASGALNYVRDVVSGEIPECIPRSHLALVAPVIVGEIDRRLALNESESDAGFREFKRSSLIKSKDFAETL